MLKYVKRIRYEKKGYRKKGKKHRSSFERTINKLHKRAKGENEAVYMKCWRKGRERKGDRDRRNPL